ncbi:acetyl-CoA carboxylase carboxyltransferase subunit [Rhodococcus sp. 1163]|uniref:acyl-CoA carboxylase subunit beta n=1 Tax=Rhodococcus sp. 1163 TaxID=1905289 RepID=UPI000A02643B|nr:carboxyl transferase domain-containing protein [Rhodococcus sp. 1163]ORI20702.1 acetyl-CoA carboxylase carboxyltransferase subunit [Rhodococcus sp. 1163]
MSENRDDWKALLTDLDDRRGRGAAMGGPAKVDKYRSTGRRDARDRVRSVVDSGTFTELGQLAGEVPADAFIAGSGVIDGRPVLVGAEDFTVAGGSIGLAAAAKRARLAGLAKQERVPLIMMLEGAGHRATNALQPHPPSPNDLQLHAELSGLVPTVAIVTGPSAGHGALTAPLSDFVVMVAGHGALFTAGPPLVAASTGEQIDKNSLGGPKVAVDTSGVAHNVASTDSAALALARRYLSYFPTNAWGLPPHAGPAEGNCDVDERSLDNLLDLIPPNAKRPYDMVAALELLVDADTLLEIQPTHATSIITALGRIGGHAVAIVANQPKVLAGSIDVGAANKAARFIEMVGAFHLPVIFLADNPGVMAGSASERAGILRAGSRMFAAQHRLQVPKFHVTVRKAFGFGSSVMGMNPYDNQTLNLAFPGVTLGGIPAEVGGRTARDDDRTRRELVDNEASGPWRAAGMLTYDDVIDPRELRNALLAGLRVAGGRRTGAVEPIRHTGYIV